MASTLDIQLLGGFSVKLNGQQIHAFRTAKARGLLAYLVFETNRQHSRATLATLFWGEVAERAAMSNLRVELSNLKAVLAAHPALELARANVAFRGELATSDAHAFQEGVAAFMALPADARSMQLAKLAAAVGLYQGEFLAGLHLSEAPDFEDWQLLTREQLHEQMMVALETLQAGYAEAGRWVEMADACRHQLALVPWTEAADRGLMQALAAQGKVQEALSQFKKCRAILQKELGVEPSLTTLELATRLRSGKALPPVVRHNLTQQIKAFIGRSEEIGQLQTLVKQEKLVTVLGIGGVGKSHLALAVAENLLHDFADGVWFVSLTTIEAGAPTTDRIALAVAATVGFALTKVHAPLSELSAYLKKKRMLLLLDNCDHLVEPVAPLIDALLACDAIHILATSRSPLRIRGEKSLQLQGLPVEEAVTLFLDRARQVSSAFASEEEAGAHTGAHREAIARICREVEGLPLQIELAASWVKDYSVAEIGRSMMLPRDVHGARILDYSWRRLSSHQQQILSKLAIFRGGFDRVAATVIAESKFADLSALISHSLVQHVAAGRYDLHPLIQEFAAGKVEASAAAALSTGYCRHYLRLLIDTPRHEWTVRLRLDFENIRNAWQRALAAEDAPLIEQAVTPFGDYIAQFGLIPDGERLFQEAAARFEGVAGQHELVARLLGQQSIFSHAIHGLQAASRLQERLLTLTNNRELQIKTHSSLAIYHAEIGEWREADAHFDRIDALVEQSSDLGLYIRAVENRTRVNALHFRGDFAEGIARLREMVALLEAAPEPLADANEILRALLRTLSSVSIRYGDYAASIRYWQQSIPTVTSQRQQEQLLGGLGLSEEYAGLFEEALGHYQEALALAMEIGDIDFVGVLKVNLCLTLRQLGELEEALIYGLEAVEIFSRLGHIRLEGQGRNRLGHTFLALARWEDADAAYGDAQRVLDPLQHPNRYEALAGRAVAALRLGRQGEAMAMVEEVLVFVGSNGVAGIVEPVRLYLNCECVLSEVGQAERARQSLQLAQEWVEKIAGRISDDIVRFAFLNNRPDNKLLRERLLVPD